MSQNFPLLPSMHDEDLDDLDVLDDLKTLARLANIATHHIPQPKTKPRVFLTDKGRGLRTVDEVLASGREERIVNFLRMTRASFDLLCTKLELAIDHTHAFPLREKVAMYLQYVGQGVTERKLEEAFQRPRGRVNATKQQVRHALVSRLYDEYVTKLDRRIIESAAETFFTKDQPLRWPLRSAVLAMDCTHVPWLSEQIIKMRIAIARALLPSTRW
jgi:hypothetical protein